MRKIGSILAAIVACGVGFLGYVYLTLPDVAALRTADPVTTAFMELRAEEARARHATPKHHQHWVPYARIAPTLRRAVLVAEDDAFWQHEGIDVKQIRESIERDLKKGGFARGGSTITQQLAKNLYLSPSKNPVRKLRELLIARRLEAALTKTRIFEIYLNVIEWGDGVWGAEAAAQAYFRKPASALTAEEAALLAACISNPHVSNPAHQTPGFRIRAKIILSRMNIVIPPPEVPSATDAPAPAEEQQQPPEETKPPEEGKAGEEAKPGEQGKPPGEATPPDAKKPPDPRKPPKSEDPIIR